MEDALRCSGLFDGVQDSDLPRLLACTGGKENLYAAGDCIFAAGEQPEKCAILCSGRARLELPDGTQRFFSAGSFVSGAALFSESDRTRALVFRIDRIRYTCGVSCVFHHRMAENLTRLLSFSPL